MINGSYVSLLAIVSIRYISVSYYLRDYSFEDPSRKEQKITVS